MLYICMKYCNLATEELRPDKTKQFQDISLLECTVRGLIGELWNGLHEQLKEIAKSFCSFC
jgi:hypothetical protein